MEFHANWYDLVLISPLTQADVERLFEPPGPRDPLLIDSLSAGETLGGLYGNTLVISSPHFFDFIGDTPGPFAEKIIGMFPSRQIMATHYYSVTGGRGVCLIKNSRIEHRHYQSDEDTGADDRFINVLEDEYMLLHAGMRLPSFLGLGIKVTPMRE